MPTYVVIGNFTDQGIRHVKDSPQRARAFETAAAGAGVQLKGIYWTIGQYDIVIIAEARDDESLTAALLSVGTLGNIRTQTLRAFDVDEMTHIIAKMPS